MLTLTFANNSPGIPVNYQGQPDLFITADSTKNVLTITITNYDTVPQTLTPGQATLTITPPTTLYPTTASMQPVTVSSPWTTIVNGGVYPNWTLNLSGETSIIIPASGGFLTLTLSGITVASTIPSGSCEFWQCSWSNFGTENGNAYPDSFIYDLPTAPNAQFQAAFMNGTAEVTVAIPTPVIVAMSEVMGSGNDNSVLTTIPNSNLLQTSLQFSLYSPQGEQISFTSSSQITFVIPGCPNGIPDYSTLCYQEDLASINLAASSVPQPTLVQNAQGNNSNWTYTPAVGTMGTTSIDFTLSGLNSNLTTQNRTVVLYMSYTGIPGFADGLVMLAITVLPPQGYFVTTVNGQSPPISSEQLGAVPAPYSVLDVVLNQSVTLGWTSIGIQSENIYIDVSSGMNIPATLYGTQPIIPFPDISASGQCALCGTGYASNVNQPLQFYLKPTPYVVSFGAQNGDNSITVTNPFYKATLYWDVQFCTSISILNDAGTVVYSCPTSDPTSSQGSWSFHPCNYIANLQNAPNSTVTFQLLATGYNTPQPTPATIIYGTTLQINIGGDGISMQWDLGNSSYNSVSLSVEYFIRQLRGRSPYRGPFYTALNGSGNSGTNQISPGLLLSSGVATITGTATDQTVNLNT